ncbi:LPS export ABC transporter periplasmic protein LptC, partial [Nitrospinota bacterium]
GTIAYFLSRPLSYEFDAKNVSILGSDADLRIDRMHVVQNKRGEKNWEMWAGSAKIYREQNTTELESIHIRFYLENGDPMDITADSGVMENESRNIRIRGNVLIKTSDGYSLHTDTLRFFPKEKRIDTDAKIVVAGNSFRLTGVGLQGRTDLGHFSLGDKVEAVIYDVNSPDPKNGPTFSKFSPPLPEGKSP